jgi:RNA polymerase sigma factor for flagellar operon FliA
MTAAPVHAEQQASRTLEREDYEHFLPMVRRAAMRLARKVPVHITVNDLVGYGWVGLMEAFQRADPAMPAEEFDAYASYRVRGAMLDYLRSLDPTTRDLRRASRKVTETIRDLTAKNGRVPEEEEIAQAMGVGLDAYRGTLERIAAGGMARLELLDLDDVEACGGNEAADESLGKKQLAEAVALAIDALPQKLREIMALRYQEECTLREIGEIMGVTESRISQLHSEAMHRLRAHVGRH